MLRFSRIFLLKIKSFFVSLKTLNNSPHSIALGFAIGTFFSILPTPGFSVLATFFILYFVKKINKIAAVGSFLIWNPVFLAPVYAFSYYLGSLIKVSSEEEYEITMWKQIFHFSINFLLVSFLIAIFIAILSYFIIKYFVLYYQNKRNIKSIGE